LREIDRETREKSKTTWNVGLLWLLKFFAFAAGVFACLAGKK